jgi:hypothetical protein
MEEFSSFRQRVIIGGSAWPTAALTLIFAVLNR